MNDRFEAYLRQNELNRAADIVRWADMIMDADPEDLLTRTLEVLDLAYTRGYERACAEHGAAEALGVKTPKDPAPPPPPKRITCPACSREIDIRPLD